nr:PREDICTED: arylsulfatase B-like [Bemisia tabaci]
MFCNNFIKTVFFLGQCFLFFGTTCGKRTQPHIILIIADDVGWNDVGFRGSNQIPTPNIDALAYNGIVFDRHYTLPCCSPSRTALLTGKYPIRMGLQGLPLMAGAAEGIPLNEVLLSERLQELGYVTRMVGKWHLGYYKTAMTPTRRGFHSHFGYYNAFVGYKNAICNMMIPGFDCYRDTKRSKHEVEGKYLTDVYTREAVDIIRNHSKSTAPLFLYISHLAGHAGDAGVLEVRNETENAKKYSFISDPLRQLYAGVIEALDDSVGAVVEALDTQNMLENSIIIFISDNGGMSAAPTREHQNTGSNWPLRGLKLSPFEGGVRGVAVAWSRLFRRNGRTSANYMHISDWFPTLYSAAGGDVSTLKGLDGVNQWFNLVDERTEVPRNQLLVNINEKLGDWAIIVDEWKLVKVNITHLVNFTQLYYGETGRNGEEYSMELVTNSRVSKILRRNRLQGDLREEYAERRASLEMTSSCAERIAASNGTDPLIPSDRCNEVPCLFNIQQDPCEFHNVADQHPSVVDALEELLEGYAAQLVESQEAEFDPAAHPKNWDGYWAPWLD